MIRINITLAIVISRNYLLVQLERLMNIIIDGLVVWIDTYAVAATAFIQLKRYKKFDGPVA